MQAIERGPESFFWWLPHLGLDRVSAATAFRGMKNGQFNEVIAQHLGLDLALVKQLSRTLREADLLTTGARGVNAPHMVPRDAARLVIAALAGSIPTTVVTDVQHWGSYQIYGIFGTTVEKGPFLTSEPDAASTLEDALTLILGLYGMRDALIPHVWSMGDEMMLPDFSVTISERPKSATIKECGLEVAFGDMQGNRDLREISIRQKEALQQWQDAAAAGDIALVDLIEEELTELRTAEKTATARLLSGKPGVRVARTVTQVELLPLGRDLALVGED